jgi:signal transduction histidine kinase
LQPCIEIKSKKQNQTLTITFKDNGSGIDLTKKGDQVFGLYKRFHKNIEGKGMGLFMVKTQVETLGGKISITSEVNKGTEFRIEFKLYK